MDRIVDFLHALGILSPGRIGWITVIVSFVIAAIAAWFFMPRMRMFSLKVGWADEPNARRINKEPLPNAGGLAIYASVTIALIIVTLLHPIGREEVQIALLAILLGGAFMILAGFIDDQFGLPPVLRLVVQLIAALLLVSTGLRIEVVFGGSVAGALSILLTVVWIMAITNAVNLIDGIDGLAGGVSFITAMSLMAVSAQIQTKAAATLLLAAVAGAALGFLRHNFPPSRIIMGDSGAYFLGFVLAASSILGNVKVTTVASLFPTMLFLFLPVVDTVIVIVRRLLRRANPISSPGTDHLHHRLLAFGFTPVWTTLLLWGITMVANIVAMAVQGLSALVIVITTLAIIGLLALAAWRRRVAFRRAAKHDRRQQARRTEVPGSPPRSM